MNRIIILIIALCVSNLWSFNSKYSGYWKKSQGPFGGYISDILVYEDNLFCATRAGLFKKQGSNPWEFVGLGDVAIREINKNDQYIYAVGYYGCYRYNIITEDIQELYSGTVQTIATLDSMVFIGLGHYPGMYRSTNFGETWEEANNGIDNYDIEKILVVAKID